MAKKKENKAVEAPEEKKDGLTRMQRKKQVKDVWENYHRTGKICFLAMDHYVAADLDDFTEQPTDGILYDLGILPENTHILAKDGDMNFDYFTEKLACAEVIEYLANKVKLLQLELADLKISIAKVKKNKTE